MKHYQRSPLSRAVSAALTGSVLAAAAVMPAQAQEDTERQGLDEIIVTAQKRTQNLQDVAVSVQVLGETQLQDLNVDGFDDYIEFLPSVSYTSNGPGYGILYMRGISSGGDGVHSGSMPSVGVYLDEQPLTTINQVLDLHIYDIARIETLPGPQGTLFGQGSQAGTLRIITNKPVLEEFQGSYDVGADTVSEGDLGYTLEGMLNVPIMERAAVRLVGWHKEEGGYIDNIPGSLTYAASGISIDNSEVVEENFNTVETSGARAMLRIDLNDNWTFSPSVMYQQQEAQGLWAHDPEDAGDLKVVRYFPDGQDEDWIQAAGIVEGNITDDLQLVYSVSTLDRDVDSTYDYTGYAEYIEDLYAYYGYACYFYDALGGCADPSQYIDSNERFTRLSHEIRLQSSGEDRFRWIIGAFTQKQVHDFDLQWIVPDMEPADSVIENGHTTWQTYQIRTDRDEAYFGEATFDLNDSFSFTAGLRHFKYDNRLYGFNGFLGHCTGFFDENGVFVEDQEFGTPQYPCFETRILDDSTKGSGNSIKASLEYRASDDVLLYATYSEGFRSGGVNRARVPGIPKYKPDWVYNYEFGWKTTWLDGRMRFNGAAYRVDWEDFQYAFLDFAISNLTIIGNVGQARTWGSEFDFSWLATDNLNLTFAASYNDATLQEPYWRSDLDRLSGEPARAPAGTEMPFVPEFQFTSIGRYSMDFGDLPGYVQAAVSYTGDSWNNLEIADRSKQDGYMLLNLSTGIQADNWTLDLFINNVTDERAQIFFYQPSYPTLIDSRTVTNRPRSIGIRFGQSFD
ncbi:MAG TPA: TonB-dependent receptor [Woeseiaceae bacterium]|nr:TonB-dependent receptor [Woeseiaceae bacterium]